MKTLFVLILLCIKYVNAAFPQVELVNCPNPKDYIKEGDTKTCGCRIKTQGTPPGQPAWLDSDENLVGDDAINGVQYMSFKYNSEDPKPTYYCRGVSLLGNGSESYVTYSPKFAYGPSQISITFYSNNTWIDTINKCEETTSFNMYCDIAKAKVNPKPTMIVTSSDGSPITPQRESTPSGYYRYKFKVVPKGGGIPTITCLAANTIFSDLTTTESKTITVQEPPPYAPVMTVTISNNKQTVRNGGIVTVTSGDTVQVKCRVDGGFPWVRHFITACAGVTKFNNGEEEAIQTVSVKKEDNGWKCSCKTHHVTGCDDKTSEFTLNVQYTPAVTGYKANSESQNLTVTADETVTFVCDAESNPRPTMSIKGQRSGETVTLRNTQSGQYGQRIKGTKVMSCQDTDEYICVADNGVGDGAARTVSVFVKCVPELPSVFSGAVKLFSLISGTVTDLKVTIPIIGYPEPREYMLTKVGFQHMRRRRRAVTEVDKRLYNVTYTPGLPPNGEVVLRMFGMTGSDIGQYILNIDNGIEEGLDYTFIVITEKDIPRDVAVVYNVDEDDDGLSRGGGTGIWIGTGLAIGLALCVMLFFVRVKVQKMRSSREKEDAPTQRMSQHSQQQPHHEQQQQHQHQQRQQQQMQEEEEEGIYYLESHGVSQASVLRRDRTRSRIYLCHEPKNTPKQQQQQQQEEEAPSRNQRIQLNDNNTVCNDTHQKESQIYWNVTMSPRGMGNSARKDNSRPTASPGIYEIPDSGCFEESVYVEADTTTGEIANQSKYRPDFDGYLTPFEINIQNP